MSSEVNDQRFAGRVALVTGGASGIGAAAVRRFLAEGARVATLDLNAESSDGVLAVAGDVSTVSADVDAALARVEDELGPIDVLVCAAGIAGASRSRPSRSRTTNGGECSRSTPTASSTPTAPPRAA